MFTSGPVLLLETTVQDGDSNKIPCANSTASDRRPKSRKRKAIPSQYSVDIQGNDELCLKMESAIAGKTTDPPSVVCDVIMQLPDQLSRVEQHEGNVLEQLQCLSSAISNLER